MNCKKGTQRISHEWGNQHDSNYDGNCTSTSPPDRDLEKKPAITLCAFECTKPKVHHRVHNSPPTVPILSHTDRVRSTCCRSISIPPSHVSPDLSLRFTHHKAVCTSTLSLKCYVPHPCHSNLFDRPDIW
jgi:hypothetical protein